jgi:hypothetical protein
MKKDSTVVVKPEIKPGTPTKAKPVKKPGQ